MSGRGVAIRALRRGRGAAAAALCALSVALGTGAAHAQILEKEPPAQVRGVDVEEKLGERIPLDLAFESAEGERVVLGEYFGDGKPVVLALVYYDCPIVCSVVLDRMAQSFNELDFTIGEDFNVVVVSFDHTETREHARAKKILYTTGYNREVTDGVRAGWGFHVGDAGSIRRLADSVGFAYRLLESGEYSHPVSIMILSPEGRVTRYLYGFDYPARELKLSLLDASEGRIARSLGDRILHFCYRYDPAAGSYSLEAMRVMQIGGVVTMVGLAGLVGGLLIRERVRRRGGQREGVVRGRRGAGAYAPSGAVAGQAS